jgi:hypothetical protein
MESGTLAAVVVAIKEFLNVDENFDPLVSY